MIQDLINAGFELAGVIAALMNFRQLMVDREVRGVNIFACAFFTVWGAWNLYYYGHLNQPLSQLASLGLVIANGAWLLLFIKIKSLAHRQG